MRCELTGTISFVRNGIFGRCDLGSFETHLYQNDDVCLFNAILMEIMAFRIVCVRFLAFVPM